MIIYDAEIKKAIADRHHPVQEGIEYCAGWDDFENMGISCICAYDYDSGRFRVFCEDNMAEFVVLACCTDLLVGFNNKQFDNKLLDANGLFTVTSNVSSKIDFDAKSYDILEEIWIACGLSPEFHYPSHLGYGLNAVIKANFPGIRKTGHGAIAPINYQQGRWGDLIDYCLNDVFLTKRLFDRILETGELVNPKRLSEKITIRKPD